MHGCSNVFCKPGSITVDDDDDYDDHRRLLHKPVNTAYLSYLTDPNTTTKLLNTRNVSFLEAKQNLVLTKLNLNGN